MPEFPIPRIWCYGNYKMNKSMHGGDVRRYGAHTMAVEIPDLITIWFSYETPIAFQVPNENQVFRDNDWGPTTGSHISMAGKDANWSWEQPPLPSEEFEEALEDALAGQYLVRKFYKFTLVKRGSLDEVMSAYISCRLFDHVLGAGGLLFDFFMPAQDAARAVNRAKARKYSTRKVNRQRIYISSPELDGRSLIM